MGSDRTVPAPGEGNGACRALAEMAWRDTMRTHRLVWNAVRDISAAAMIFFGDRPSGTDFDPIDGGEIAGDRLVTAGGRAGFKSPDDPAMPHSLQRYPQSGARSRPRNGLAPLSGFLSGGAGHREAALSGPVHRRPFVQVTLHAFPFAKKRRRDRGLDIVGFDIFAAPQPDKIDAESTPETRPAPIRASRPFLRRVVVAQHRRPGSTPRGSSTQDHRDRHRL